MSNLMDDPDIKRISNGIPKPADRPNDTELLDEIVDSFSIHLPKGRPKGTLARRNMKKRLHKRMNQAIAAAVQTFAAEVVEAGPKLYDTEHTMDEWKAGYNDAGFKSQEAIQQTLARWEGKQLKGGSLDG